MIGLDFARTVLVRAILKIDRSRDSQRVLSIASIVCGDSVQASSVLAYAALRYYEPGCIDSSHVLNIESMASVSVSTFVQAMIHHSGASRQTRIRHLTANLVQPPAGIAYASAMLDARFIEAYEIWREIPEVQTHLAALGETPMAPTIQTIAIVLPGPARDQLGKEIDNHGLVARTSLIRPDLRDHAFLGERFDIALLNRDRFASFLAREEELESDDYYIVTNGTCTSMHMPPSLRSRVRFELGSHTFPTTEFSYIPVRAVAWCLLKGYRPTLYNGDFYLGDSLYQDKDYDAAGLLEDIEAILESYLMHDVFFCHAILKRWLESDSIEARGNLESILELSGQSFAEALENKWLPMIRD